MGKKQLETVGIGKRSYGINAPIFLFINFIICIFCGNVCLSLVYFNTQKVWRVVDEDELESNRI